MADTFSSLLSLFDFLPFHTLYSHERREEMERAWVRAHQPMPLSALLNTVVSLGIGLCVLSFFGIGLLSRDWVLGLLISCILLAIFLMMGFLLPAQMARRFASSAESDLPLALRSIALYLSIKMPLEKALQHVAGEGYASSPLWHSISSSIEGGESVPGAISSASGSVSSPAFARASSALITYYEDGGAPDTLVALADELTHSQVSSLREQAAKAGVGGLVFVAMSSILPAFALVLMVAAGPILDLPHDPTTIWLLFLFGLPLLNSCVLIGLLAGAPALAGAWRPEALNLAVSHKLKSFGLEGFSWKQAMVISVILFAVCFALSLLLPLGGLTLRAGLVVSLLPLLLLALLEGEVMGQVAEAEAELPHLLLGAASSGRFSLERLLEQAQHLPAGPLREQANEALRQIRAGANPLSVLSDWAAHTPSVMLSRALTLLSVGWRAGGSMAKPLRALSDDALASGELVRERAAQLATQRYTLMAAGALLVPAILAVSLSFSAQVASVSGMGVGEAINSASTNSATTVFLVSQSIHAAASVVPLYLVFNSFLVALYLALASGARERFIPYAAGLVFCSQLVWMMLAPGA